MKNRIEIRQYCNEYEWKWNVTMSHYYYKSNDIIKILSKYYSMKMKKLKKKGRNINMKAEEY